MTALHSLTNEEAAKSIPVVFPATVTYHVRGSIGLFLQDGGLAIYADAPDNIALTPGDRVLVRGKTRGIGYRPDIVAESVTVLSHGEPPEPAPATYTQLVRGEFDCVRVKIRAKVRSADLVSFGKIANIYLELLMDGGSINAIVDSSDANLLQQLRDADVEVSGSTSGKFDSKKQLTGIVLKVPSSSDIKVLKTPLIHSETLSFTPLDHILEHSNVRDLSGRVRVQGTITYYLRGEAIVLQDGAKSLWIETKDQQPINVGDWATVSGFPAVHNGVLTLSAAEIQDSHRRMPVNPQKTDWDQLYSGANAFDLVSLEGQVVKEEREEYQDRYLLTSDGHLFSVLFRHTDEDLGFELPPMKQVPVGATVHVTGVASVSYGSNPFEGPSGFDILLRSFDDIQVKAQPSWWNVHNLTRLIEILLGLLVVIGIRVIWTERRNSLRNAVAADLERRRGQILEDINGARPLAEILERIHELASARLGKAPCWIQVYEGATLGNAVSENERVGLRILEQPIPSRSGPPLGIVCVAFGGHSRPAAVEHESLLQAAGLARLAIETARAHAELVRRSEFDLLTGTHNRFSFGKQMEIEIQAARKMAGLFGLLYIDLNDFKQINDRLGHHIGDLYLQEVVQRIKEQLRPIDIVGRLGGDEFAVLLPNMRGRADAEEITLRLERCFDRAFTVDGHILLGTASIGIAIYPADGTSGEGLMRVADSAMYAIKRNRRRRVEALAS